MDNSFPSTSNENERHAHCRICGSDPHTENCSLNSTEEITTEESTTIIPAVIEDESPPSSYPGEIKEELVSLLEEEQFESHTTQRWEMQNGEIREVVVSSQYLQELEQQLVTEVGNMCSCVVQNGIKTIFWRFPSGLHRSYSFPVGEENLTRLFAQIFSSGARDIRRNGAPSSIPK